MGNTTAVQSANSRRIFKTLGASFLRLKAFAWLLSQWSLSHAPCMRSLSRSGMSLRFLIGSLDYPRPVRSYAAGSVRYICYSSSTNTTFPFSRGARRGFNSKTTLSCEFLRSKDTDPYSSLLRTQVPPAQPQVSPTAHAHLCPNALLNGTSFSRTQRLDRFWSAPSLQLTRDPNRRPALLASLNRTGWHFRLTLLFFFFLLFMKKPKDFTQQGFNGSRVWYVEAFSLYTGVFWFISSKTQEK